tara:strand:- start:3929 stop:4210 length:282 start_codon:yes stop_codon:yes gene_type:complete
MENWFKKYGGLFGFGVLVSGTLFFLVLENFFNINIDSSFLFGCFGVMAGAQTIQDLLLKRILPNFSEKSRKGLIIGIVVGSLFMFFPMIYYGF